jgi:hypothetical protein
MALRRFLMRFLLRHPRVTAAVWFGMFALGATSGMFLLPVLVRSFADHLLYLTLPSLSGALAGYFSGWQLLVANGNRGLLRAAGRGLAVALEAFAIFSLLFTASYRLLGEQQSNPFVFFVSTLTIGGLATGPIVFPTGALAAVLLYRLGRYLQ